MIKFPTFDSKFLVHADKACNWAIGFATVATIGVIALKIIFHFCPLKNDYSAYIKDKKLSLCLALILPLIGQVYLLTVLLLAHKKQQDPWLIKDESTSWTPNFLYDDDNRSIVTANEDIEESEYFSADEDEGVDPPINLTSQTLPTTLLDEESGEPLPIFYFR